MLLKSSNDAAEIKLTDEKAREAMDCLKDWKVFIGDGRSNDEGR